MRSRTHVILVIKLTVLLALFAWNPQAQPQPARVMFEDVTARVGIDAVAIDPADPRMSGDWGFIAIADYDRDGWDDLLLNLHPGVKLYKNTGKGTFELQPNPLPPVVPNITDHRHVFLWCDFNGDGYDDLITGTGFEGASRVNLWMRNNRNGTFTDVAAALGVQDPGSDDWSMTCVDIDRNGRLDVLMARKSVAGIADAPVERLWMNYGTTLRDEAEKRGFTNRTRAKRPYAVVFSDLNRDGQPDGVGVGNNYNSWFLGKPDGTYTLTTGVYTSFASLSPYLHDADFADFNGDGLQDAVIVDTFTTKTSDNPVLRVHCNNGLFNPSPNKADGLRQCWASPDLYRADPRSLAVGDFDNDGAPDLFLTLAGDPAGVGRDLLYMNDGMARFTEVGRQAGIAGPPNLRGAGGVAVIDYDLDGRLDLVVGYNMLYYPGPFRVYRNVSNNGNSWVGFILRGPVVGSWVEIAACGMRQIQHVTARTGWLAQHTRNAHFGLGTCRGPVNVTVTWPDGQQTKASVRAGAYHTVGPDGAPDLDPTPPPRPTPRRSPTSNPTPDAAPSPTPAPTQRPSPTPTRSKTEPVPHPPGSSSH